MTDPDITAHVRPAREQLPAHLRHTPAPRSCRLCGTEPPAGHITHPECRGQPK